MFWKSQQDKGSFVVPLSGIVLTTIIVLDTFFVIYHCNELSFIKCHIYKNLIIDNSCTCVDEGGLLKTSDGGWGTSHALRILDLVIFSQKV